MFCLCPSFLFLCFVHENPFQLTPPTSCLVPITMFSTSCPLPILPHASTKAMFPTPSPCPCFHSLPSPSPRPLPIMQCPSIHVCNSTIKQTAQELNRGRFWEPGRITPIHEFLHTKVHHCPGSNKPQLSKLTSLKSKTHQPHHQIHNTTVPKLYHNIHIQTSRQSQTQYLIQNTTWVYKHITKSKPTASNWSLNCHCTEIKEEEEQLKERRELWGSRHRKKKQKWGFWSKEPIYIIS